MDLSRHTEENAAASWLEEKRSAHIYGLLSNVESGRRKQLFKKLAIAAETQANLWANSSSSQRYVPGLPERLIGYGLKTLGPRFMRPALRAVKVRGLSVYSEAIMATHEIPESVDQIGQRHHVTGASNNIRAAIFGINDGLISTASLIFGVAAATHQNDHFIFVTSVAGLFAGACSMAAGEFISVTSQTELLKHQLALEKAELEMYPDEETAELALIYEARGMSEEQAKSFSKQLIGNPAKALETLAREELGINPADMGSPWGASVSSFVAFSVGGVIPVLPFVFHFSAPVNWTIGLSLFGLFITGSIVGFLSGRGLFYSGARMVLIGSGAGLITHIIGLLAR